MTELPDNWILTPLGDIVTYKKGKKPSVLQEKKIEGAVPYLDIKALEKGEIRQYADIKSVNLLSEESIAMVWDGARSGWVSKGVHGGLGSTIAAITPILSDVNYLFYFLQHQFEYLNNNTRGTGIPHVDPAKLWNISLPLAPLAEQKRIADKLDLLFQSINSLNERLDKIPFLLKQFKERVIEQAVTGELTREWRKGNRGEESADKLLNKIQSFRESWARNSGQSGVVEARRIVSKLHNHSFEEHSKKIPKTWAYSSLLKACLLVVDCHNKTAPYERSGIYLIRTSNVKGGKITLDNMRYVSHKTYEFWSKRCKPLPGDIIFTREAPIGEAAVIPENMTICLGQRTMLLRVPTGLILSRYVLFCLLSPSMAYQVSDKSIGSGVKHLRVGDVESLVIPIPPLLEQEEIVRRVDELLSIADKIDSSYNHLKKKIEDLPSSTLDSAFKGELAAQDDNDEPASNLLARIMNNKSKKGK